MNTVSSSKALQIYDHASNNFEKRLKTEQAMQTSLRLLNYNIQVGIATARKFDYVSMFWKHFLPHNARERNMKNIADLLRSYDIVGLQELDGGSFRTNFINQTEYLAKEAGFECWHDKINRNIGMVAKHSLGLLSRLSSTAVTKHSLPGGVPGRGALVVEFGNSQEPLALMLVHLSLGKKARMKQVDFLCDLVRDYRHVILMGDMNCEGDSEELRMLKRRTGLKTSSRKLHSYPSWNPGLAIDHILVSPSIHIRRTKVLKYAVSDHLPIAMEVELPKGLSVKPSAWRDVCRNAA